MIGNIIGIILTIVFVILFQILLEKYLYYYQKKKWNEGICKKCGSQWKFNGKKEHLGEEIFIEYLEYECKCGQFNVTCLKLMKEIL